MYTYIHADMHIYRHIRHFPYLAIGQPNVYLSAYWNKLALSVICLGHFKTQKQSVSFGELYNVRDCHSGDRALLGTVLLQTSSGR